MNASAGPRIMSTTPKIIEQFCIILKYSSASSSAATNVLRCACYSWTVCFSPTNSTGHLYFEFSRNLEVGTDFVHSVSSHNTAKSVLRFIFKKLQGSTATFSNIVLLDELVKMTVIFFHPNNLSFLSCNQNTLIDKYCKDCKEPYP